jgi:hypothetical protein
MVMVRAQAEFQADFPDDGIEDESGWVVFAGRGVAAAIAEMLRGIGCEASDPIDADEHGWELEVDFKKESMWCQVTVGDGYILTFTDDVFMGNYSKRPGYLEAITKLNLEMQRDARFHDVCWYMWRGPRDPGANAPLDVDLDSLPKRAPKRAWFWWMAKQTSSGNEAPED